MNEIGGRGRREKVSKKGGFVASLYHSTAHASHHWCQDRFTWRCICATQHKNASKDKVFVITLSCGTRMTKPKKFAVLR